MTLPCAQPFPPPPPGPTPCLPQANELDGVVRSVLYTARAHDMMYFRTMIDITGTGAVTYEVHPAITLETCTVQHHYRLSALVAVLALPFQLTATWQTIAL